MAENSDADAGEEGTTAPPTPRLGRLADALLMGAAIALALFLLAQLVSFSFGRDQAIYSVVAKALLRGEPPYRAAWDFKPPGIFFVFAGADLLFGTGQRAIRILEALALLKPPLGGGILVSGAILLSMRWRQSLPLRRSRALARSLLAMLLGAALPLIAVAAYFTCKQALSDLYQVLLVFVPGYTALGLEAKSVPELLLRAVDGWILRFAPYSLAGLAALCLLPSVHPRERAATFHVLGVISLNLLGVVLQAKFFPYHFPAMLLLTALLVGWGFRKIWLRTRESAVGLVLVALTLGALQLPQLPGGDRLASFRQRAVFRVQTWARPGSHQAAYDWLDSRADVDAVSNREVAQWLRDNTPAGSTIFVWGFEPVLYLWADRRPASRYIHNVSQRSDWFRDRSTKILMEQLEQSRPAAIVVVHHDALPLVTGNTRDSHSEVQGFPELLQLIQQQYRFGVTIADLDVYVREPMSWQNLI